MGSYNETCALTRLPIDAGEQCIMVVLNKERMTEIMKNLPWDSPFSSRSDLSRVTMLVKGTYNDYGWLEELASPLPYNREKHLPIFFRINPWKKALKSKLAINYKGFMWNTGTYPLELHKPKLEQGATLEEFSSVLEFAEYARVNILAGINMAGRTDDYEKQYDVLLKMTQADLKKIKQRRHKEQNS